MRKLAAATVLLLALFSGSCSGKEEDPEVDTTMHYTANDTFVVVENTPYGTQGCPIKLPRNAEKDKLYGTELVDGKIKVFYNSEGVQRVEVDGKPIPEKKAAKPKSEDEEDEEEKGPPPQGN